jgi:hypothetical protein
VHAEIHRACLGDDGSVPWGVNLLCQRHTAHTSAQIPPNTRVDHVN